MPQNTTAQLVAKSRLLHSKPDSTVLQGKLPRRHRIRRHDVASVAVMLAMNDYMTGQTISVNGGWYMS